MVKLILTIQYEDPNDHLNIKEESIILKEFPDKEMGYLYSGIVIGALADWESKNVRREELGGS